MPVDCQNNIRNKITYCIQNWMYNSYKFDASDLFKNKQGVILKIADECNKNIMMNKQ